MRHFGRLTRPGRTLDVESVASDAVLSRTDTAANGLVRPIAQASHLAPPNSSAQSQSFRAHIAPIAPIAPPPVPLRLQHQQ